MTLNELLSDEERERAWEKEMKESGGGIDTISWICGFYAALEALGVVRVIELGPGDNIIPRASCIRVDEGAVLVRAKR